MVAVSQVSMREVVARRGAFVFRCPSWDLPPGLSVLVGLNGAGKSTFLELLAGRLSAAEGRIIRTGVGSYLPQGARLDWPGTVASALLYLSEIRGVARSERHGRMRDAIAETGLESVVDKRVRALSGGWHRRLLVAQCLVDDRGAMLLDEPTDALDVGASQEIWTTLRAVARSRPVLVATHQASAAVEFADHLIAVNNGVIRTPQEGPRLRELLAASEQSPDAFLLEIMSAGDDGYG